MNKHDEHCKHIADELKKYVSGEYFLYDGKLYPIDADDDFWNSSNNCSYGLEDDGFYYFNIDGDLINAEDVYPVSIYEYFEEEIYNIDYICNSYKQLEAVRVMVACGGPNIYINTWDKEVQLRWWTESGSWYLTSDVCDAINDYFEEMWNL